VEFDSSASPTTAAFNSHSAYSPFQTYAWNGRHPEDELP
jgi:hypothetical protein